MISGEWLDSKKVDQVEWWHYVDIIIPKQTTSSTGIMFIDGGEKSDYYFRLDAQSIGNAIKTESVIVNVYVFAVKFSADSPNVPLDQE